MTNKEIAQKILNNNGVFGLTEIENTVIQALDAKDAHVLNFLDLIISNEEYSMKRTNNLQEQGVSLIRLHLVKNMKSTLFPTELKKELYGE